MAILPIHVYGSPILHRKLAPIGDLPEIFDRILADMWDTMCDNDGIGLSANQAGLDLRFFVADFALRDKNMGRETIINPEIVATEGESVAEEGCLSLPGIREQILRAEKIVLRYENLNRQVIEKEFNGYPARVVQHETDHLNGIVFTDRISSLRRSFIKSKLKRLAELSANGKFAKDAV